MIGQYAKSIVMIVAAGLGVFAAAITDNVVTPIEYTNIGIATITAIGVYRFPNASQGWAAFTKTFVGIGGAALAALATVVANMTSFGAVTPSDWLGVALAGLAVFGLWVFPNKPAPASISLQVNHPTL